MPPPKVLVIDDLEELHFSYKRHLGERVRLFSARTIEEARQVFRDNPDLSAIAVDACLAGVVPDTLELIREFRQTFTGPMIAISGDPDFRRQLMAAGCTHECGKAGFPLELRKILSL